jgi:hypothetical protein
MHTRHTAVLLIFIAMAFVANGQPYAAPAIPDTAGSGRYIQRTMHLLATSTPAKRNTVKILVYGQSISEQKWWLEVKKDLLQRYPHANLIMENKAIGGFSSSILVKTVEMDVSSFYPDLVLFHVYGDQKNYESIIKIIRSRTAAEVALQTDHYTKKEEYSDKMAYEIMPALARKYSCEVFDIRTAWKQYLHTNGYEPSRLLSDGVHLNDHGNFLMAELVKPYLHYKPNFKPDEFQLVTTYKVGSDVFKKGNTLRLPFTGNRVDVIAADSFSPGTSAAILVDGKKPSTFQGTYFMSRPYSTGNKGFPWTLPAMIHVHHEAPWVEEEWTCTFTEASPPFDDFAFAISGSKTGEDGAGRSTQDFVSRSKKVIIKKGDAGDGGDWHVKRSYQVLKTEAKPGDTVRWKTYTVSRDLFIPERNKDRAIENSTTLFQGIPTGNHVLTLKHKGKGFSIKEIKVYKPYLDENGTVIR